MFEVGNPSSIIYDGTHTVDFETALGFTYAQQYGYILDHIIWTSGPSTFAARFLNPNVNEKESILWFPPGIVTSMVVLRVRSGGGGDWRITPVRANGTDLPGEQIIPGATSPPYSVFICSEDAVEMRGVKFSKVSNQGAEPQVYEVCVPQDPESCIAQPD